jgi:hypothetical protein
MNELTTLAREVERMIRKIQKPPVPGMKFDERYRRGYLACLRTLRAKMRRILRRM